MVVVSFGGLDAGDCEPAAAVLEQFTPLAEALRPGFYAFAARGPSRYFGGEQALAELVARAAADAVTSTVKVGVGVADGLFAAGLAARRARRSSRLDRAGEPVVRVVPSGQAGPFLAGLPLSSLTEEVSPLCGAVEAGMGRSGTDDSALVDVLWRLGMRTLGDVASLSEADMVGRFGWTGLLVHRLACGLDDRPVDARPAPEDSGVEAEIDPPADRVETVAFTARTLADDMVGRLARNGLDCVCIDIEACSDSGHTSRRRWRHEFRFSAAAVVDRVRWQLEGWYRSSERPTGPVTLIRLTPCEVAPAEGRQLGMWGARSAADERAAKAMARVQGLLGAGAVTVPRLSGGRRPADTGRRAPLHDAEAEASPTQDPSTAAVKKGKKGRTAKTAGTAARAQQASTARNPETTRKAKAVKKAKAGQATDAPWPGRLPSPSPAVVLAQPEPLAVTDRDGDPVTVSGRGEASAAPWQVTDSAGRNRVVVDWAGPWPLDERWWHPRSRRRQARFQLILDDGSAHLCVLEAGSWQREATYD